MEYSIKEWDLRTLIDFYEKSLINLNPPYQRGDIWTLPAKKRLIESIKLKYPLPAFFLYQKNDGSYDMVDGQQRTRTIIGYSKGFFPDINKVLIDDSDKVFFFNSYKIAAYIITKAESGEIEDFYYRVNKFGTKLNRAEIIKAQFGNSILQNLVERIADSPQFISLEIFSENTLNRLNDLDFIGEILTLIKYGITDKKITVDKFYNDAEFSESDSMEMERIFYEVLEDVIRFNDIFLIKNSRYKQRSDFYTLFSFLLNTRDLLKSTLDYFYKLLIFIDKDISPTQENCFAFQQYATNCVSQSNSKRAREERLQFLNELLLNKKKDFVLDEEPESTIEDALKFYHLTANDLILIEDFYLIDINKVSIVTDKNI